MSTSSPYQYEGSSSTQAFQLQDHHQPHHHQGNDGRNSPTNYGNGTFSAIQHEFYHHALSVAMGRSSGGQQEQRAVGMGSRVWPAAGTTATTAAGDGVIMSGGPVWQQPSQPWQSSAGSVVGAPLGAPENAQQVPPSLFCQQQPQRQPQQQQQQVWLGAGSTIPSPMTNGQLGTPHKVYPLLATTACINNGTASQATGPLPYQHLQLTHQQQQFASPKNDQNTNVLVLPYASTQHPTSAVVGNRGVPSTTLISPGRVAEGTLTSVSNGGSTGVSGSTTGGTVFPISHYVGTNGVGLSSVTSGSYGNAAAAAVGGVVPGKVFGAEGADNNRGGSGGEIAMQQVQRQPQAQSQPSSSLPQQQQLYVAAPQQQQQQQLVPSLFAQHVQQQQTLLPMFADSSTGVFAPMANGFIGALNMLPGGSGGQMMHTAAGGAAGAEATAGPGAPCVPFPALSFLQLNPLYPGLRRLVESPPLHVVDDFFTHPECDALMALAGNYMVISPVVGAGAGEVSESRTSSSCFLAREDLPTVCSKVMALTGKPFEHLELPQVGRYYTTQKYANHWDAFDLSTEDGRRFAQNGGQRVCTVLVYLNDVGVGGCTSFPRLGLRVQPKKGMAVIFFPATLDGTLDPLLLHAAEPAVDTKWVSQIWIRQGTYHGTPTARIPQI